MAREWSLTLRNGRPQARIQLIWFPMNAFTVYSMDEGLISWLKCASFIQMCVSQCEPGCTLKHMVNQSYAGRH